MNSYDEFLAVNRHDDIVLFLSEHVVDEHSAIRDQALSVETGCVLTISGTRAQQIVESAIGMGPMAFAKKAMGTRVHVDRELKDAACPSGHTDHETEFILAFSEAENQAVGGLYAQGPVIHAYTQCSCGALAADKWVADAPTETGVQPGSSVPVEEK